MAQLKDTEVSGAINTDYLEITGNINQPVLPIGAIVPIHPDAPTPNSTFYHFCDGSVYPDGISIGGSVNSPNLVNYFLKGGVSSGQVAKTTHSLITSDLPSHNHPGSSLSLYGGAAWTPAGEGANTHTIQVYTPGGGESPPPNTGPSGGDSNDGRTWWAGTSGSLHTHTVPAHYHAYSAYPSISNYGNGSAFSIMPLYYVAKFFIRYR